MRLFHVSEQQSIAVFHPRRPARADLNPDVGLVWAINERCLPNFLTPRDCPRVTYHVSPSTTAADKERFLSDQRCPHVVAIERRWFAAFAAARLYLYEFDAAGWSLQDEAAGYYVSTRSQAPIGVTEISDVPGQLLMRRVELRVVDSLWQLHDAIQQTSFFWSMCRMRNAAPRRDDLPMP